MFLFNENKNENSSYADYIPYYLMVNPHTVLNKNMFLMSCFQYVGFDLDLLSVDNQTIIAARLNNVIRSIPENFGLHFDSCRIRITGIPRGIFKQPIAQEFRPIQKLTRIQRQSVQTGCRSIRFLFRGLSFRRFLRREIY